MLPKSRIIASLLAGLGIALLVGGLLAPRVLNSGAKLPLDLGAVTLTMADPDGTREGGPGGAPAAHGGAESGGQGLCQRARGGHVACGGRGYGL
ncbi:hypothetical protein [Corynebacterium sp. UMB2355A]|uniref:hypothetical protein n=1 Tax=Corynebacterium sp. UMB2355A TaxID=3081222 RepID=UPI0029FF4BB4|nr:hypothetical protein [Corynebacterium sp. UMB2355A]WPJ92214.1 hypothetical protein R0V12_08000 [Corynebacterium sp. UMB2355A]